MVEKAVDKTIGRIASDEDKLKLSVAERLRLAFEELGPAFVKFGQLLATRPDLVPADYAEEFKKLHDQVHTLSWTEIKKVLTSHFGQDLTQVFKNFDETPLAAASIAQVHMAVLQDGTRVVVKIQRPGVEALIEEDLGVLYNIAELIEKYIPEARIYNPLQAVDEFARALELETNFIIEANNIRRFKENFANEPSIKIPEVYSDLSGKRVLVLEALDGIPLSHKNALDQEGISPEQVLKTGLRCYLKMVFTDGLFHGDLHAGNFFVLKNNRIGLIDFGVVGRLNRKTQSSIASMLISLATEDYDRLAYEYVDLAPYSDHVDVDLFARDLRDLISPYYGLTLRHVNVGKLLMDSSAIAAQYRLQLPPELIMFFKSIVTIEGMGRVIMKDFNFLAYSLEFASELMQSRAEPTKILADWSGAGRDLNSLLIGLPRQLKQLLRRFNNPDAAFKLELQQLEDIKAVSRSSAQTIFYGLVIAALILGGSIIQVVDRSEVLFGMSLLASLHYITAAVLVVLQMSRR